MACIWIKGNVSLEKTQLSSWAIQLIIMGLQWTKAKSRQYWTPTSKKELISFLGMVNYYAPHIPRLAEIAGPLNMLTGWSKKRVRITLGEEHVQRNDGCTREGNHPRIWTSWAPYDVVQWRIRDSCRGRIRTIIRGRSYQATCFS